MLPGRKSVGQIFADQPDVTQDPGIGRRVSGGRHGGDVAEPTTTFARGCRRTCRRRSWELKSPGEALAGFEREAEGVLRGQLAAEAGVSTPQRESIPVSSVVIETDGAEVQTWRLDFPAAGRSAVCHVCALATDPRRGTGVL